MYTFEIEQQKEISKYPIIKNNMTVSSLTQSLWEFDKPLFRELIWNWKIENKDIGANCSRTHL